MGHTSPDVDTSSLSVEESLALDRLLGDLEPGVASATTPTPVTRLSRARLEDPYFFPGDEHRAPFRAFAAAASESSLIGRLGELVEKIVTMSPDPIDYVETRDESCELGLELNRRRGLAPALRPFRRAQLSSVKEHSRRPHERWLVADRIVIELDWLRSRSHKAPIAELQDLVSDSALDIAKASEYASRRMKAGRRGLDLGLPEYERLLLTSFHSPETLERAKTINAAVARTRAVLLSKMPCKRYRLTPSRIAELTAIYRALRIARGSAEIASAVVAHVGGPQLEGQALRDAKKKLITLGCPTSD